MVCHLCSSPASLQCPICNRFACSIHSKLRKGTSSYACADCVAAEERLRMQKWHLEHWCDFCQKEVDSYIQTCAKCKKSFCTKHGEYICMKRDMDTVAARREIWIRCENHRKGWFDSPDYIEDYRY